MKDEKLFVPEALSDDEVEIISGGRGLNAEEDAAQYEINRRYEELRRRYYAKWRIEEWHRVEEIIHQAAADWYQAIRNAPEGHPTIPFSDFFNFEEYEERIEHM